MVCLKHIIYSCLTYHEIMLVKQDILGLMFRIFYLRLGLFPEAATGGVLWKKMFLEISQNSQENTCVSSPVPDFNLFQFLQMLIKRKLLVSAEGEGGGEPPTKFSK